MDSEQLQRYDVYMATKGNRQYLQNPFSFDWLPYVTGYYGYYIDSSTETKEYHEGVDIGVPEGTAVLAGLDGTVTFAGNDGSGSKTVILDDGNGLTAKYEHCGSLLVSTGQTIKAGNTVAKAGSAGLYLEIDKDGQSLNPLYFAVTGDDGQGPSYSADPGAPMDEGSYAALIAEAEKYLGYPYVWGGSTPETSFDCSGFVCWVLNQSGVANVGRTTAQGLYNLCTPVSPDEAQPGDLIFFQGTYSTSSTVTHVGIYVGNGRMIQAGNPIGYADITTSYWQSHFYAFGRIH
jgi:cell wall-associated NlpC family hydrolase